MKNHLKQRPTLILIGSLVAALILIYILIKSFPRSDSILALTALIVLWYTYETHLLRLTNQELLHKSQRPVVGFNFFANSDNQFDARFQIVNQSDYPVAVRAKLNFKINDEAVAGIWPEYSGLEYWNLQYKQAVEGHFNILEIYKQSKLFVGVDFECIRKLPTEDKKRAITKDARSRNGLESNPALILDLEVFAENDKGDTILYPPMKYAYHPDRAAWIPKVTSDKPYWEYETVPPWVKRKS